LRGLERSETSDLLGTFLPVRDTIGIRGNTETKNPDLY
jgi:hypothetical protein